MEFFALNIHLFKPLIYKNTKSKDLDFIKITPVNLVESERRFIKDLEEYLDKKETSFDEIYLLRNPSRKGIGFFETKNFYPDFILWTINGSEQTITFIDPKGLVWVDLDDEKIKWFYEIKDIQDMLNKKEKMDITLNCCIVTETLFSELKWNTTKPDLEKKNIFFMDDTDYLDRIFSIILE